MKKIVNSEAKASSRYLRVSPFKVRRILDQIRGRSYFDALIILKFMPYKACSPILKVLLSAVNNAKQLYSLNESSLFVTEARADAGPILKRFRPHAQGRGFPIKKPMCHIVIKVSYI
uniref:Large ribosomal subunit protein uL22c n=1 Tax=Discoplastis spathirhyncha TaxID=215771 RepID=A0A3G3LLC3_9EUGL|nr:ribosomal protein L22 [Discoplastis spathirhyncha]AYQ93508.1 ribosomal protein L22 [Discoplastis spathirhyncha]